MDAENVGAAITRMGEPRDIAQFIGSGGSKGKPVISREENRLRAHHLALLFAGLPLYLAIQGHGGCECVSIGCGLR